MFFFRADSNSTIASGHIMRCLSIAKALIEVGAQVRFLTADDCPSAVLESAGIEYTVLDSDWRDLMTDAQQVKNILLREEYPVLVIDTYSVTKEYVDFLRPFCRIVYLGSKQEYLGQLDVLINYSADIDTDFYVNNYGKGTKLLLGVSYAPLREEFRNVKINFRDTVERILITTGNTDGQHIVPLILEQLRPVLNNKNICKEVVVGRMFDNREQLYSDYGNASDIRLRENVASLSALMESCDLAISASGTTIYELSAVGLPAITFAMAEEQIRSAEAMAKLGVTDYCGRSYENMEECLKTIAARVEYYLCHHDEMIGLAQKAHSLIDGNGCEKIVSVLIKL